MIPKFATCLNWELDAFLEQNEELELQELLKCYVCKIAPYSHCNTGFALTDSCHTWVRIYGMQFMKELKNRMIKNRDEISECLRPEES